MTVLNETVANTDITTIARSKGEEIFINLQPLPYESISDIFQRFADALRATSGQVVMQTVFGPTTAYDEAMRALVAACGDVDWPVTWLQGGVCEDAPIAGIQAHCVRGMDVRTLRSNGRIVGRTFDDGFARYAILGDVRPDDYTAERGVQTQQLLDNLDAILKQEDMEFADIARTWLYPDRILEWYGTLNTVRTRFFWDHGIFDRIVPASTGIGGANAYGGAIVAEAFAVKPLGLDVSIKPVSSPLQCSARDYGSSFSRALQIATPDVDRMFVSGTASIEPGGRTVHVDDVEGQINLTFRVIEAILEARCMDFTNVTRSIAYFKYAKDAPLLTKALEHLNLPPFPMTVVESDICRDDLLFEVELDAIRAN